MLILSQIVAPFNLALPALDAQIGGEAYDKNQEIKKLADLSVSLSQNYPEADSVYWHSRAWQLWLWQVVYLSVWSVARFQAALDIRELCHETGEVFTRECRLPEQEIVPLSPQTAVVQAADYLEQWLDIQQEIVTAAGLIISTKLMRYFMADAILKALAAAYRFGLQSAEQIWQQHEYWRAAFPSRCVGKLIWLDDMQEFHVELAACCQHYRRAEKEFCVGCPKLKQCSCDCQ